MTYRFQVLTLIFLILLTGCQPLIVSPDATPIAPAPAVPDAVATPSPEQASGEELYQDPQGRFTVPIPTNWTAETVDGYVVLASPQEQIQVYILALPGQDVAAAVNEAWRTVDPTVDREPADVAEQPSQGGVEQTVIFTYDTGGQSGEYVAAVGQLYEDVVYTLLVRGAIAALQQRAAQFNIIQSGFTIAGIDEVDLTGVQPLPVDETITAELESYINDALSRFGIPGAAVAIVQNGEIVYSQGFGVRQQGSDEAVTPETRMMIGSTGKTMTTMLMATLVDDGLMAWDTPVVEVLPEFAVADPQLTQQITMRNLVCACTGVPRRDLELFFNTDELSAEDVVESLATFEFFTDFGEAFQYSNQLVATGGYAAAAAAGGEYGNLYDRYVQEMNERIFQPIGMANTTFSFEEVTNSDNYALPHGVTTAFTFSELSLSLERIVIPVAPAGAPWSNVLDMGRYLITELNAGVAPDGERVVSAENLAVTWEPQVPVSAEASYGLGWFVDTYKGQPMIHHGGNTLGFTSDLAFLPDADLGISVLTNGQGTNYFNQAVRFRLFELLFEQAPEADAQATFAFETGRREFTRLLAEASAVDPATVEPFLGNYTNPALGEVELRLEEETLVMDAGEFTLEVRAQTAAEDAAESPADRYIIYSAPLIGELVQLVANEAGEPTLILGQGAVQYQFEPVE